jgi:hypothetical protein
MLLNFSTPNRGDYFFEEIADVSGAWDGSNFELPWTSDGVRFSAHYDPWNYGTEHDEVMKIASTFAQDCVPQSFEEHNLMTLIADYYLLEALSNGMVNVVPDKHIRNDVSFKLWREHFGSRAENAATEADDEILKALADRIGLSVPSPTDRVRTFDQTVSQASKTFESLVQKWAPVIEGYMWFAIVGELQYYRPIYDVITPLNDISMAYGWAVLMELVGKQKAAEYAAQMFSEKGWFGSYGGKNWAMAAKVVGWYNSGDLNGAPFSPAMFLDRCFSLQHNTGSIFNKKPWSNGFLDRYQIDQLLTAHGNSDWKTLSNWASDEVVILFRQQWRAANAARRRKGYSELDCPLDDNDHVFGESEDCPCGYCNEYQEGCGCNACTVHVSHMIANQHHLI